MENPEAVLVIEQVSNHPGLTLNKDQHVLLAEAIEVIKKVLIPIPEKTEGNKKEVIPSNEKEGSKTIVPENKDSEETPN